MRLATTKMTWMKACTRPAMEGASDEVHRYENGSGLFWRCSRWQRCRPRSSRLTSSRPRPTSGAPSIRASTRRAGSRFVSRRPTPPRPGSTSGAGRRSTWRSRPTGSGRSSRRRSCPAFTTTRSSWTGRSSLTPAAMPSSAAASTPARSRCRKRAPTTTPSRTSRTGRCAKSGTRPSRRERGGTPWCTCHPAMTRRRRRGIRSSTCSMAAGRTRPAGSGRGGRISSWIT